MLLTSMDQASQFKIISKASDTSTPAFKKKIGRDNANFSSNKKVKLKLRSLSFSRLSRPINNYRSTEEIIKGPPRMKQRRKSCPEVMQDNHNDNNDGV